MCVFVVSFCCSLPRTEKLPRREQIVSDSAAEKANVFLSSPRARVISFASNILNVKPHRVICVAERLNAEFCLQSVHKPRRPNKSHTPPQEIYVENCEPKPNFTRLVDKIRREVHNTHTEIKKSSIEFSIEVRYVVISLSRCA